MSIFYINSYQYASGGGLDADASQYINNVEAQDSQQLESGVRTAINDFVVGCKSDGIWNAIKASCILAGARTLDGALVPLTGSAPTNNNFVGADYDRETGLKGDGSTKWLDANRAGNADPFSDYHVSTYINQRQSIYFAPLVSSRLPNSGADSTQIIDMAVPRSFQFIDRGNNTIIKNTTGVGFVGMSHLSGTFTMRYVGSTVSASQTAVSINSSNWNVFARGQGLQLADARLSFYSIGESLDLAKLDTRVSNLMTAIGAAIP